MSQREISFTYACIKKSYVFYGGFQEMVCEIMSMYPPEDERVWSISPCEDLIVSEPQESIALSTAAGDPYHVSPSGA